MAHAVFVDDRKNLRNMDRFPDDFMFSLTREEIMGISQFVTSSMMIISTIYAL